MDIGAAHALPPAGAPGGSSSYLVGGVRVEPALSSSAWLFGALHGGVALRRDSGDWASLEAGLGGLFPVGGGTHLGLGVVGEAFTVGGALPYRAAVVRAEPELRHRFGGTTARLYGAGGIGRSRVGSSRAESEPAVTSDLWSYGGGLELLHELGSAVLRAGAEGFRAARESEYASIFAGAHGSVRGVDWVVELRGWDTPEGGELVATAALRFPIGRSWEGQLSGGRFGPDPLLEAPAGVSTAALLGWRALRFTAGPKPLYTLVGAGHAAVRFELRRQGARDAQVLGDFSDWKPVPMREEGDGRWTVTVPVAPGVYRFGFLVDGQWFVPPGSERSVEDEWGRRSATLVVPPGP
ncbi:MAG: glycogen-binding domain-containing protein [Gemmatimonadota bacterium]